MAGHFICQPASPNSEALCLSCLPTDHPWANLSDPKTFKPHHVCFPYDLQNDLAIAAHSHGQEALQGMSMQPLVNDLPTLTNTCLL